MFHPSVSLAAGILAVLGGVAAADEVRAKIEAADRAGREFRQLIDIPDLALFWADDDTRLIYRSGGQSAARFTELMPATGETRPAFDAAALARALAEATGREDRAGGLPLRDLKPAGGGDPVVYFTAHDKRWRWHPDEGLAEAAEAPGAITLEAPDANRRSSNQGRPVSLTIENSSEREIEILWLDRSGEARSYGRIAAGARLVQNTYAGHAWRAVDPARHQGIASFVAPEAAATARVTGPVQPPVRSSDGRSPDGRWTARFENHNLILRPDGGGDDLTLTDDGTAADRYAGPVHWAPDSRSLVIWRVPQVETRRVHIVQAAPPDQVQPKLHSFDYAKPGDDLARPMPRLFSVHEGGASQLKLDESLFETPWTNDRPWWSADGGSFEFLHNRRGHQLMRLIRLDARTGQARVVIEETSPSFIDYSQKTWLHRLDGGREILWMSERDGYNHILLIDAETSTVKRRVTRGEWNVRRVLEVDEVARELLVETIGMDAGNPGHSHFARVAIDADRLVRLTSSPGHHEIERSPGGRWITATWSRPDHPPVVELRDAATGAAVAEIARGDDSRARARDWQPPERFTAKGRDGETDIHGLIYRPIGFDPALRYPVVENIYAGPHGFFVPQNFSAWNGNMRMAHHGFIIVQIDGMGTNWRSKKFHDVAWKNLSDSGFPDRIAWIRAAAETRPWMDLSRVGIYGGSAGGQSTVAGLLHHGDFYHTGVADCGCHDNRMDKLWWNEAWMGWPIDDSYADNSNVTHAGKLRGNLMLVVGEMDRNVDPASTDQLAAALQQAGKRFEYVKIFNVGHGAAESSYGNEVRTDFLIRHLGGPQVAAEQ